MIDLMVGAMRQTGSKTDVVNLSFRVPASTMKGITRETYDGAIWMSSFLWVSEPFSGVLRIILID